MRTTLTLHEDVYLAARHLAQREKLSLGDAVSLLARRGFAAPPARAAASGRQPLRGRFALLPARDEIITAQKVRELMEREGI